MSPFRSKFEIQEAKGINFLKSLKINIDVPDWKEGLIECRASPHHEELKLEEDACIGWAMGAHVLCQSMLNPICLLAVDGVTPL